MRLLVVSDSHGLEDELTNIFNRHEREIEEAFHCGDSQLSATNANLQMYRVVRGNCDFGNELPLEIVRETSGGRVLCVHGHKQDVKYSLTRLGYEAEEHGANIVLYGHSHVAEAILAEGVLYVNPGSIRMPRGRLERTYAIIEVNGRDVSVRFFESADGHEVEALRLSGRF